MKVCPICGQTYDDESLRFCLSDGAVLEQRAGAAETLVTPKPLATKAEESRAVANRSKGAKRRTRFWMLCLFGGLIAIASILIGWVVLGSTRNTSNTRGKIESANSNLQGGGTVYELTPEKYESLKNGMTYQQVAEILGGEGSEFSSSETARFKTVIYRWQGQNGSHVLATFQNGRLVVKFQSGIK